MYVHIRKTVYTGFGTIHGFRHPLKVLDHIPQARGGTTVQRSSKDGHFSCSDQNILSIDL